jgi:GGDEF domain-containing protein
MVPPALHGRLPAFVEDMKTLFENADSAMYLAKEEGRNTYKLYNGKTV